MAASCVVDNVTYSEALANQDNQKVTWKILHKFKHQIDWDELEQCGRIALWKALQSHDPNHPSGQKFTSTLHNFVKWECLYAWECKKRATRTDDVEVKEHHATYETPPEISHLIDNLPEQRQILARMIVEGYDFTEIAKENNWSIEFIKSLLDLLKEKYSNQAFKDRANSLKIGKTASNFIKQIEHYPQNKTNLPLSFQNIKLMKRSISANSIKYVPS